VAGTTATYLHFANAAPLGTGTTDFALDSYVAVPAGNILTGGTFQQLFTCSVAGSYTIGVNINCATSLTLTLYDNGMFHYVEDLGPIPP
jgi:hypothetical protein